MKKLIAIALLVAPSFVAAETWVDVNVTSVHIGGSQYWDGSKMREYNESNKGLGITTGAAKHVSVTTGFYSNSVYRNSSYLAGKFHTENPTINASVTVGVVTGYLNRFTPMVLPSMSMQDQGLKVTLGLIPTGLLSNAGSSAITFQLSVKIR